MKIAILRLLYGHTFFNFFSILVRKTIRNLFLLSQSARPLIYVKYSVAKINNITRNIEGTYNPRGTHLELRFNLSFYTGRKCRRPASLRNIANRSHSSHLSFSSFLDFSRRTIPSDRSSGRTGHFVEFTGDQRASSAVSI